MPKDNIERAIAKGSGADADAASFETVVYEGYGPEDWPPVLVEAVTDGETGLPPRFDTPEARRQPGHDGCCRVAVRASRRRARHREGRGRDELVLLVADAGADDVELDSSTFAVTSPPEAFGAVRGVLADEGFIYVESAELAMVPKTTVAVSDESTARRIMNLVEELEDTEDVQEVYANFDIPEAVLEAVVS